MCYKYREENEEEEEEEEEEYQLMYSNVRRHFFFSTCYARFPVQHESQLFFKE
jgi:hypothetical protein